MNMQQRQTYAVGDRVNVTFPVEWAQTFKISKHIQSGSVSRVVAPDGLLGGLFVIKFDSGIRLPSGADWIEGNWISPL